jgi:hypothetical protein
MSQATPPKPSPYTFGLGVCDFWGKPHPQTSLCQNWEMINAAGLADETAPKEK